MTRRYNISALPAQTASPLQAIWVFLPVLGSLVAHAPVLKYNLLPSLHQPLDGGLLWRGRRIFGENKTWRGALCMWSGAFIAALLACCAPWYQERLPVALRSHPLAFAALLGLGVILGELPNSFLKRQLDIAPGQQRRSPLGVLLSLFDQGDFVPGAWLCLSPLWVMSLSEGALCFVIVVLVHLLANLVGYAIGARKTML